MTRASWKLHCRPAPKSSASTTVTCTPSPPTSAVTERLAPLVPRGRVIVSESGIFSRDDLRRLSRFRVNAALVGEALVTAPDVAAKVRELSGQRQAAGETRPQP